MELLKPLDVTDVINSEATTGVDPDATGGGKDVAGAGDDTADAADTGEEIDADDDGFFF